MAIAAPSAGNGQKVEAEKLQALKEKIYKLLKLAEHNSSRNEAYAALERAQAMMAEYHISMTDVEAISRAQAESVVTETADVSKARVEWRGRLAQIICDNMRCEMIYFTTWVTEISAQTGRRRQTKEQHLKFIGLNSDVAVAVQMFTMARATCDQQAIAYAKWHYQHVFRQTVAEGLRMRTSFCTGFCEGLASAFQKQLEAHPTYALMTIVPQEVKDFISTEIKTYALKPLRDPNVSNQAAFSKGYAEGTRFKDAKPSLVAAR